MGVWRCSEALSEAKPASTRTYKDRSEFVGAEKTIWLFAGLGAGAGDVTLPCAQVTKLMMEKMAMVATNEVCLKVRQDIPRRD